MNDFDIGDLVIITDIVCFEHMRDPDIGKFGVIVGLHFDWAVRADILYIQIDGNRKGFYTHEVELIVKR